MKIIVIAKSNGTPVQYYGGNISWWYFHESSELHIFNSNGKEIFSSYSAVIASGCENDCVRFVDPNFDDPEEGKGEDVHAE